MSHAHSESDGHGHHSSRFIQHHFDDAKHQFDSGKLGIWLFLVTEILFFSGLFVAYIVYRSHHTEIFDYAHAYLDTQMGAINTGVLILSSLTAAWAVRAAQLNQQKLLTACLTITLLCACGFLGIKYLEYSHKVHVGTLFGKHFKPCEDPAGKPIMAPAPHTCDKPKYVAWWKKWEAEKAALEKQLAGVKGKPKLEAEAAAKLKAHQEKVGVNPPKNTAMFFSIYFGMTGLHGIHVLMGVLVFIWLLTRAVRGHITPDYYGPIDYAALYWHLVDLIWIYLFPMLYLIH